MPHTAKNNAGNSKFRFDSYLTSYMKENILCLQSSNPSHPKRMECRQSSIPTKKVSLYSNTTEKCRTTSSPIFSFKFPSLRVGKLKVPQIFRHLTHLFRGYKLQLQDEVSSLKCYPFRTMQFPTDLFTILISND